MMKSVVLIILDGWGSSEERRGNAIAAAQTPTIDRLGEYFPSTLLQASGISVGLPWNEPGNSEVGHMNMGTGSIRYQPLTRINKSILDRSFFKNRALEKAAAHVRKNKSALHIMGLLSSGSVHAYRDHLHAILEFAQREGIWPVFLHLFLDGRDAPLQEGAKIVAELSERLRKTKEGVISTVIGRRYAMDRDKRWERTERAYELIVKGKGELSNDLVKSIRQQYEKGLNDEFVEPLVAKLPDKTRPELVGEGDAVIFFNFREDSVRQLASAFSSPQKNPKFTPALIKDLFFVTMTQYREGLADEVILAPLKVRNTVSELVSAQGWQQLKIAESEKYAHVTYFFNGGKEEPFDGEERKLLPSVKVESYAEAPRMRAQEIGNAITDALGQKKYHFIVANFANADMVAHTGDFEATKKAAEAIDETLGPVISAVVSFGGICLVTADHGHAEEMLDLRTGKELTKHSTNPVPFYLVDEHLKGKGGVPQSSKEKIRGILSDVAATVLDLFDITPPDEIEGKSLLSILS